MSNYLQHMECSMLGFPVLLYLSEFVQIHVHWVSDNIQPSHPLQSPSPPAFSLSQHQGLFQWQLFTSGGQSIGTWASHQSFQWLFTVSFRINWLDLLSVLGLSRVFSSTSIWKHQSLVLSLLLWSDSHLYLTTGKIIALTILTFLTKWCLYSLIYCLGLS